MPELMERLAHQIRQVKAAKQRLEVESQALASILAEVSEAFPAALDADALAWERLSLALGVEGTAKVPGEALDAFKLAEATSDRRT